ncbi:Lnb N-terminal periplasmic domain-containing protein [Solimonas marina]|uniref:DUF4105 domain-containing protein n=1 Tax=Solimonas marina TaxID=2714601 RepID=A0A969WC40_9GAMM|nr:DUF4105 domain-containing protein [Solimonas marina]NKF23380.1 DUF4105 domain-containing protein [Solimonas marina]
MKTVTLLTGTTLWLLFAAWGAGALWFRWPAAKPLVVLMWALSAVCVVVWCWRGHWAPSLLAALVLGAMLLFWWQSIRPSNNRRWADDVARQLVPTVDGDQVTLDNVRDFRWRTPDDYDVRWETRHYDLSQLRSVDTVLSYWMGPAIAHTLVSFGFADGRYLTFSIEIRKERGESFSAIGGFFKQFEATLVAADERDIVRVRTNVRGEDDYLYRVQMPPEAMRSLFLAYLAKAERLRSHPRWYNTATANCTTIVFQMMRHIVHGLPLDPRLLLSGYLPEYLARVGALTPGYDVATLRRDGRITERARDAGDAADFSQLIRAGVPGIDPSLPAR